MTIKTLIAVGVLAAAGTVAQSAVTFSFADPAPGKQLRHTSNGAAPGSGTLTYDLTPTTGVIRFIVGSNDGSIPTTVFANARMDMNIDVGLAVPIPGGYMAPLSGSFRIFNATSGLDILTGTFGSAGPGGTSVIFGASGALITNSITPNDLVYTAGPELTALLPSGLFLAPLFDAVFTITDIAQIGPGPFVSTSGEIASFDANASFSGTSELIPTPGTMALLALSGLVGLRRRR
jgi:uncharacterized protein (TIGR03382 family)